MTSVDSITTVTWIVMLLAQKCDVISTPGRVVKFAGAYIAFLGTTSRFCLQNPPMMPENTLAMRDSEISEGGILAAVFLSLVATVGSFLTNGRHVNNLDWVWIGVFVLSLLTLSAAVVNFDVKRLLK
jgi:hypothetical protein